MPKGSGQQGRGLIQAYRYGLFAPGKSRIVIDTTGPVRIERGGHGEPAGASGVGLNIDLVPTDRASFLTKLPPPAPQANGGRGRDQDDLRPAPKAACQAGDRHRCRAWRASIPGAASGEVLEKDVVLSVARHLRTILAAKGRYDVHMTRASDVFVSLDRRLAISRQTGGEPVHLHPCRHASGDAGIRAERARRDRLHAVGAGLEQAGPAAGRQGERRRHAGRRRVTAPRRRPTRSRAS